MSFLSKRKQNKNSEEEEILDENYLQGLTIDDSNVSKANEDEWLEEDYEGQLSVDVFQTNDEIVIKSTIAGVKSEDLDVTINNDMVTIKGKREEAKEVKENNYFLSRMLLGRLF